MILAVEPEKILTREALAEPHRAYAGPRNREEDELRILSYALRETIEKELLANINSRTQKQSPLEWWARRDSNPRPAGFFVWAYELRPGVLFCRSSLAELRARSISVTLGESFLFWGFRLNPPSSK